MRRKLPQPQPVLSGADLREHRTRLGISQAELARRLHYSRSYVCHIEHGMRMPLSLARALLALLSETEGQRSELMSVSNSLRQRRG